MDDVDWTETLEGINEQIRPPMGQQEAIDNLKALQDEIRTIISAIEQDIKREDADET